MLAWYLDRFLKGEEDVINRDDDCSYPKILDNLCDNLERSNFLMWIQYATQDDIEVARKHNTEKLDELFEKYKTEIDYIKIYKDGAKYVIRSTGYYC